jgi:Cof subfamily protein (haloacid dehalogenase superfamily)
MADIQLLVLDIDGTIAGSSNEVTEAVKSAIAAVQARGIQVAIATGRMYQAAIRFHRAVGSTLPLMAYQGALIKDPLSQTVYRHTPLPRQQTLALLAELADLEAAEQVSIHLYIDDQLHVRQVLSDTVEYAQRSGVEPVVVGDLATFLSQHIQTETTKLLALGATADIVSELLNRLQKTYKPDELYLTQSVSTFFEATHPLSNKGAAVRFLAEEVLGLAAHQVMAIGDNFNDQEMLQYAGIGVAMGDAPAEVKAIAHWVAPSVEADGVVAALQQFLLN